jgi:ribonuclease Z
MEKRIEVGFLGTGGSVATADRDNTALVIRFGDDLCLVDCPGAVFQKFRRMQLDPRRLTSILVTHVHPDHIYGLPILVHSLMLDDMRIQLYASTESIRFCQDLLDLYRLRADTIKCRLEFISLEDGDSFSPLPGMDCRAMHVPHKSSSLAFFWYFKEDAKTLVYSGDSPLYPPLFKAAAGCDLLVHDCSVPSRLARQYDFLPQMHTTALDLGRLSQESQVKRLSPVHFFGELDYTLGEIETEIRRNFSGELVIPSDLEKISL